MRRSRMIAIAVLLFVALSCPTFAQDSQPARHRLGDLQWMAGYWVKDSEDIRMEECWLEPLGGVMVGVHRDVKAGGRAFYEYLRIEERTDGIYYVAKPLNQAEAAFRLVAMEAGRQAVFENKVHDFPQRIVYFLEPQGGLRATIEGVSDDRKVMSVWLMDPMPLGHAP